MCSVHRDWNTLPVQNFDLAQSVKGLGLKLNFKPLYVSLCTVFMTTVIYLVESVMTKRLGGNHEGLNTSFGMS